ncbi:MAG: putative DNA modification/repair radical SAM protein [Granulosicoccus sp.]|nr:putative DNA modification/repair radical SAM protein [Granulosicoccus sp.]
MSTLKTKQYSPVPQIPLKLQGKLAILADAAKYDASCASSGTERRHSLNGAGVGSTGGSGICHSYAPDGRCISLLKVLLTNFCTFDCLYCVNRVSSNVPRARFSVDEVVDLTLSFYKRNYIEGLFLSSGIIQSPDYTMEQVVEVARRLRLVHDFRGYIHLKTIPEASPDLLTSAGLYADRLSINVELARQSSLASLAPQKDSGGIRRSMAAIRLKRDEASDTSLTGTSAPRFATAGQSTQMIVGADAATDGELLSCSDTLYSSYKLKRVYYSAFSPIPDASAALPLQPANLLREHRLYQADWLLRFYEFDVEEIVSGGQAGMLDTLLDPKLAWALKHREQFPVDINRAERSALLRIPGLGTRGVDRILSCRAGGFLRLADLKKISRSVKRMLPFIVARDWSPARVLDTHSLRDQFVQKHAQLDLFGS